MGHFPTNPRLQKKNYPKFKKKNFMTLEQKKKKKSHHTCKACVTRLVCICVCICMYIQKLLLNPHQSKSDTSSIMYWSYYNILTPSCMRTYSRKHKQSAILLYIEDKNTSRYTLFCMKNTTAHQILYICHLQDTLHLSLFFSLYL